MDARLLIVGDDRHRLARLLLGRGLCFQDLHLAINAQHLGHLFRKVGVALLQVVSHFVRFDFTLVENLAHRALRQIGKARMSLCGSAVAGMAGEQPCRPQFVGITEIFSLAAGERHQPGLGFGRDGRLPAWTRSIVERRHRPFDRGALDATLHRLMVQPQCPADRIKGGIFPIGQQDSRPLDPACRLGSRLRYRSQLRRILIPERQFNRPPPRRHDLPPLQSGHMRHI